MGDAVAKQAHFTISGEAFTELVRVRMLDDQPGSAFRIASCLIADDPKDQAVVLANAIRLCNGTARVDGDESSMEVVDDDTVAAKRYRKKLAWLHAGRIRIGTLWYQPSAYVGDCGPHDAGCDPREKHYCGRNEIVSDATFPDAQFPQLRRGVIFEVCGERPHWHTEIPTSHQQALEEWLTAGNRLAKRAHSITYKDVPPPWQFNTSNPDPNEPAPPGRGPNKWKGTTNLDTGEDADAIYDRKEASRMRFVADLRKRILARAGDDLIELSWADKPDKYDEGKSIKAGSTMVPRAPFMIWAFAKLTWLKFELPEWKEISPVGMKMQLDDPMHTDWVIGGGFDPHDRELYFDGVYNKAAEDLRSKIQDDYDNRTRASEEAVTTLVTGATAVGPIVFGKRNKPSPPGSIVVLPNLDPKFLEAIAQAAAVITQEGGELAHLASVSREHGIVIVRKPDALDYFIEESIVEVNPEARTARVIKWHVEDPR